jgi:hypothetical protein
VLSRIALVAVAIVAIGACSRTPSPEPSAPVVSPPPSGAALSSTPPDVAPSPSEPAPLITPPTTDDPSSILLTCGGDERFPAAALAGVGLAEFENDAAAAVLKAAVAEGAEPLPLPLHGWHRVAAGPAGVVFVAPRSGGTGWAMVAARPGPDGWDLDAYGDCAAAPVQPTGVNAADFWLDRDAPAPGPNATTLHGLIRERACANGRPPTGRVRPPAVTYSEQFVIVTVTVTEIPGGADCPGNPSDPITIELSEPLGDRRILDGSVFPARDASVPPG